MAVSPTPVFAQTPKVTNNSFTNTDTADTTFVTICTGGSNGTKVTGILVTSDDGTASHVVRLYLDNGGTNFIIGSATVATNAGKDGGTTAGVDLLGEVAGLPVDNDGQPYLFLESGDLLEVQFSTAITASTKLYFTCIHADF